VNINQLFLHIGLRKSGSTFIQRFCELNREQLLSRGYFYPVHDVASARFGKSPGHWELHRIFEQSDCAGFEERYWPDDSPASRVILSNEAIASEHVDPYSIAEKARQVIPENVDVRVIVYLRRQDRLATSLFNEGIVSGNAKATWSTDQFERSEHFPEQDYFKLVSSWADSFGKESLRIRPFETSQFKDGDLIADFLDCLDLAANEEFQRPELAFRNASPDSRLVEVLRILNRVPLNRRPFYLNFVSSVFDELVYSGNWSVNERQSLLSLEYRQNLLEQNLAGNRRIAEDYLHRTDGLLFKDDSPPEECVGLDPELAMLVLTQTLLLLNKSEETSSDIEELLRTVQSADSELIVKLEKLETDHQTSIKGISNDIQEQNDHSVALDSKLDQLIALQKKLEARQSEFYSIFSYASDQHVARLDRLEREKREMEAKLSQLVPCADEINSTLQKLASNISELSVREKKSARVVWNEFLRSRNKWTNRLRRFVTLEDWRTIRWIKASGLIDSAYYFSRYPDTIGMGMDATTHFVKFGMNLGYDPSDKINLQLRVGHAINTTGGTKLKTLLTII